MAGDESRYVTTRDVETFLAYRRLWLAMIEEAQASVAVSARTALVALRNTPHAADPTFHAAVALLRDPSYQALAAVRRVVERLRPEEAMLLELRYTAGLGWSQVAAVLGTSPGRARARAEALLRRVADEADAEAARALLLGGVRPAGTPGTTGGGR